MNHNRKTYSDRSVEESFFFDPDVVKYFLYEHQFMNVVQEMVVQESFSLRRNVEEENVFRKKAETIGNNQLTLDEAKGFDSQMLRRGYVYFFFFSLSFSSFLSKENFALEY